VEFHFKYCHNRIAACTNSESEYERGNRARNRPVCLRRVKVNGDGMRMKIFLAGVWDRIRIGDRRVKYQLGQLGGTSREKPRGIARGNRAFRDPPYVTRTMLPWCRSMARSAQKYGEICGSAEDSIRRKEE